MNRVDEIVFSHFTATAIVIVVFLASFASTWTPVHDVVAAIQRDDDTSVAYAAASYVVLTAAFGAVLVVLTSLRFSSSRRRICAAWGVVVAIVGLALLLILVAFLSVIFYQNTSAAQLTPRQALARNALDLLPALTFLSYVAALTWGLLSPSRPLTARKRLVRLAVVPVVAAMPCVTAAAWFVWKA